MSIFSELRVRENSSKVYFTYDDIQKLPIFSETPLMEIINGDLFLPPSPSIAHHDISVRLSSLLRDHYSNEGKVFNAPVDLILSNENVVIPDIFVIFKENSEIIMTNNIQGVPDIIIEILSSNRNHDLIDKKKLYEKFHVPLYIVIDIENKQVFNYILENKTYTEKCLIENQILEIGSLKLNIKNIFE